MTLSFLDALIAAQERKGNSLRKTAAEAGVPYDFLKNVMQGKSQRPNLEDAIKIARYFGVTLEEFLEGASAEEPATIAVAGQVGAGAKIELVDAHPKGDGLFHVACPADLSPHGIVAVEVAGDSMTPVYEPGTILFYTRDALGVPTEAIGRICVCEDDEGRAWVKQVKTGSEPGRFHLISINPIAENRHDVALKWAAPVRLSLPKEFVRKIHT
ncbi:S24 family peptidase [Thioclava sp. DLFJ4-1]|uniref:XRE family transcriptional regulator n=1 Tax=Thioclava sp. DLFJ4-1 TaxID=1915313 RepID=UPI000997DBB5|nr:S24 family peptidase [Thioclava sp. DLFJ4-1]OOY16740.1 hypothetical protein BMI85_06655 [Thioclava sp. DLFJ4-1]